MKKAVVAAVSFVALNAIAGPFGLDKGMTLAELNRHGNFATTDRKFIYTSTTLTNGHPDFVAYSVIVAPRLGLCKIEAIGKDIRTSPYGTQLKERFTALVNALAEKYGKPGSNYDFLDSESIWKEPDQWMDGLISRKRVLSAFWAPPENLNLPNSIKVIVVEAKASSGDEGYLKLGYDFDNITECLKETKANENSHL